LTRLFLNPAHICNEESFPELLRPFRHSLSINDTMLGKGNLKHNMVAKLMGKKQDICLKLSSIQIFDKRFNVLTTEIWKQLASSEHLISYTTHSISKEALIFNRIFVIVILYYNVT